MIKFYPNENHQTVHGPGADCAFIQNGIKFDGRGEPIAGEIERKIEQRKEVEESRKVVDIPESVKKEAVCSYCGKSFKKLTSHLRWCKEKKKQDGRNAGKLGGQIKRNEPENMASGRNQTSIVIGRRHDS